jgi:hypothetical protein
LNLLRSLEVGALRLDKFGDNETVTTQQKSFSKSDGDNGLSSKPIGKLGTEGKPISESGAGS